MIPVFCPLSTWPWWVGAELCSVTFDAWLAVPSLAFRRVRQAKVFALLSSFTFRHVRLVSPWEKEGIVSLADYRSYDTQERCSEVFNTRGE
ncbi:hypothetical protein F5Y03DRAFT_370610 [Xylaria venustula]|nr:hypothetical protein F5Y03DRAFT_370610 [Xylaria venustula]